MKLPNLPILKRKSDREFILVLLLRTEKANAVIIEKTNKTVKVLNQHEEFFSSNLEDASNEEWLDILDTAISRAEETLPSDIETHQTIFGLPNSWVEDKQIKKEYLTKLKHASDELDLKPIGFIEIPEAIAQMIREEEGAPISALITEIGKKHVTVSLIKAGRILGTKSAPIQESNVKTLDTLLKTFTDVEVLPSRLIVYNGRNTEELAQSLITHHWSKSIPFLHMPQVSILKTGFDVNAVVRGAAEQLDVKLIGEPEILKSMTTLSPSEDTKNRTQEADEQEIPDENLDNANPEAFGFVVGKDINEQTEEAAEENKTTPDDEESAVTSFRSDNLAEPEAEPEEKRNQGDDDEDDEPKYASSPSPLSEAPEDTSDRTPDEDSQGRGGTGNRFSFGKFSLPFAVPSFSGILPGNNKLKNKYVLLLPLVLIVIIVLGVLYTTMVKATIEVTVRPESADQEEDITFTTEGSSDFSDNVIQAKTTTIRLSGSTSTAATGEKETGEKAKGTVTIFNSSTSKKELPEGTIITSSNGLDFALEKEVIIASASGDIFSGIESGTAKVPVIATDIGKEYNIPSDTTFKVESDSNVAARNDEAFSGGTKEEITVVSQNDIAKLTKDLPNTLLRKAEDQINEKLGNREVLLTTFADFTPRDSEFSATEGEEAEQVTLEAVVEFTGVFYDNDELIEYAKSRVEDDFSQDLTLDEAGIRTTLSDIEEDEGTYTATLSIEADLLPKIDSERLKEEFAGQSFDHVNRRLERLPQATDSTIVLFPPIPFLPQIMPRQAENIDIVVTPND